MYERPHGTSNQSAQDISEDDTTRNDQNGKTETGSEITAEDDAEAKEGCLGCRFSPMASFASRAPSSSVRLHGAPPGAPVTLCICVRQPQQPARSSAAAHWSEAQS